MDRLRRPHASIPRSPRIAEPLFLARYIEKAGTGTLDMINLCAKAGLPAPAVRQDGGKFIQTLWRPRVQRMVPKWLRQGPVIRPLLDQGLLEMTLPDKPASSQQKYRLTEQGAAWLANQTGNKK